MLARAFARQVAGKLCVICNKRVPHASFKRHVSACTVAEDDEDCQVLIHLTAEDKRRHARENFIDLAEGSDSVVMKREDLPTQNDAQSPTTSRATEPEVHESPQKVTEKSPVVKRKRTLRSTTSKNAKKDAVLSQVQKPKAKGNRRKAMCSNMPSTSKDTEDLENICENNIDGVVEKRPRRSVRLSKSSENDPPPVKNLQNVPEQVQVPIASTPEPAPTQETLTTPHHRSKRSAKRNIFPTSQHTETATLSVKTEVIEDCEEPSEPALMALDDVHRNMVSLLHKKADFYHSPTTSPVKSSIASSDENSNGCDALNELTSLAASPAKIGASFPSYHLRFVLRILHKVFCYFFRETTEAVPFWGNRLHLISSFLALSDKAQLLLVRLFLRKRRWLTVARLSAKYSQIVADLEPLFDELLRNKFVDSITPKTISLEDALNLLQANDLQTLCKRFKIDHRNGRLDLIKALLKCSKQKNVFGHDVEGAMLKKAVELMGPTYRIQEHIVRVLNSAFTLYAPVLMDTVASWDDPNLVLSQQLLYTMLNVQTRKAKYPAPLPCPSLEVLKVFTEYRSLQQYVKAKEREQDMAFVVSKGEFPKAVGISDQAYGELQLRLNVDTHGDNIISSHSALPHSLRKYTDTWVLVRIVSHGVEALQRLKDYEKAVEMLEFLLSTEALRPFCPDSRGAWWDRLALNLDAHLKDKRRALTVCQRCFVDDLVGEKDKLMLQDRALKLDKIYEFPVHITVPEPKKVTINGTVLGKNLGDQRVNHFMLPGEDGVYRNSSVEAVALDHYLNTLGYTDGIHGEGSIWHTIFGLMFYDIIFDHSIAVAWLSELQDHPTDLNTREFYRNRKTGFDDMLLQLELAEDFSCFLPRMKAVFDEKKEEINNEISWSIFSSFEQLQHFLHCCKPAVLAKIFRKFISDNRNNRSGFPDLTVWNTVTRTVAVVEVKGPQDRLSTKQRLWLAFFDAHGVEAVVCHVVATSCRNLS